MCMCSFGGMAVEWNVASQFATIPSPPHIPQFSKRLAWSLSRRGANQQPKLCLADRPLGADRLRLVSCLRIWCSRTEPPRHQTEPPPRAPAGRRWKRRSRASTKPRQPDDRTEGDHRNRSASRKAKATPTWPQRAATPTES